MILEIDKKIPMQVKAVMSQIEKAGYEVYLVGGSVRDLILEYKPKDFDLTTSATPDEVKAIFQKVLDTGEKYGTVTVIYDDEFIEVTTFRTDGRYSDGRRPDKVVFGKTIEDDLDRRDFTMNAIAYSPKTGFIDPYHGIEDLSRKQIRAVGIPSFRFREDPLRMMRAVRFVCQLGMPMDLELQEAVMKHPHWLSVVSEERKRDELVKILCSDIPAIGIRNLANLGLMDYVIPELRMTFGFEQHSTYHHLDVWEHTLLALKNGGRVTGDLVVRLAILLHDVAKPLCFQMIDGHGRFYGHDKEGARIAKKILKRLCFGNDVMLPVIKLIGNHMFNPDKLTNRSIARLLNRIDKENVDRFLMVKAADMSANSSNNFDDLERIDRKVKEFLSRNVPWSVRDLDIDGKDLIAMGFTEGPIIGSILRFLLDRVLDDPTVNEYRKLRNIVVTELQIGEDDDAILRSEV